MIPVWPHLVIIMTVFGAACGFVVGLQIGSIRERTKVRRKLEGILRSGGLQ